MKIQFNMVINGIDGIEKKFEDTIKENPDLHLDLIRSFAHTIMMAFRYGKEDNISIESFKAGRIVEPPIEITQGVIPNETVPEKSVDN
jgi:hypothetical protein